MRKKRRSIRKIRRVWPLFEKLCMPKNPLLEFFQKAPLPELSIDVERNKDLGRDIQL